ncbi:MAG: hypothetical protein HXY36_01920 [Chloroflexi bacterium]|nr:hypothetical protein [Chloroflexota bacterium]
MKKIFSILFALVLVVNLGLVTAAPVLAGTIIYVPSQYPTIQAAINASSDGDTIMVAAGEYEGFVVDGKANISIIGAEGATVTTGDWVAINRGPIGDAWGLAAVKDSQNINIEGINFDGSGVGGKEAFVGVTYIDSTGSIADLTVENIIGSELGAGVAIIGDEGTSVVDLAGVTVQNSMGGVLVWDAEATLDACTITGMNPDGGFGIMENGVGILIGIPGDDWGPSTAEVKASTISNNDAIGIYVCDDSTLEARFNKIVGNTDFGVVNDGGGTVDARYNWWGHASGPYPVGTGDAISDGVNFTPWLNAGVTETVTDGTVDAKDVADTEVAVDGTANVTVFRYPANPGGDPPSNFGSLGKYIDVYVPDTSQAIQIEIRLYYTEDDLGGVDRRYEKYLRLRWWNGTEWAQCSDSGVNTATINGYSGYMWAKIRADTSPSLADLQGTGFDGGYEGPTQPPQGICAIATAAYGTDTAKELDILREFRDTALLPNSLGAKFVSLYYKIGPPIANFISRHEAIRTVVRVGFVDPIVRILNWSHDLWSTRGS